MRKIFFSKIILILTISVVKFVSLLAPNELSPLLDLCIKDGFLPSSLVITKLDNSSYTSVELSQALSHEAVAGRKEIIERFVSLLKRTATPFSENGNNIIQNTVGKDIPYLCLLDSVKDKKLFRRDGLKVLWHQDDPLFKVLLGQDPGRILSKKENDFVLKSVCTMFLIEKLIGTFENSSVSDEKIDALIHYLQNKDQCQLINNVFGPDDLSFQELGKYLHGLFCEKIIAGSQVRSGSLLGSGAPVLNPGEQRKVYWAAKGIEWYPTFYQTKRRLIPSLAIIAGAAATYFGYFMGQKPKAKITDRRKVANGVKIDVKKLSRRARAIKRAKKNGLVLGGLVLLSLGVYSFYRVEKTAPVTAMGICEISLSLPIIGSILQKYIYIFQYLKSAFNRGG